MRMSEINPIRLLTNHCLESLRTELEIPNNAVCREACDARLSSPCCHFT